MADKFHEVSKDPRRIPIPGCGETTTADGKKHRAFLQHVDQSNYSSNSLQSSAFVHSEDSPSMLANFNIHKINRITRHDWTNEEKLQILQCTPAARWRTISDSFSNFCRDRTEISVEVRVYIFCFFLSAFKVLTFSVFIRIFAGIFIFILPR